MIGGQMITECQLCGEAAADTAGHKIEICIANLKAQRDEADRRAGAAERRLVDKADTIFKSGRWRDEKKANLGYDHNASFDTVFDDLIKLLGGYEKARELCLALPDERRR